MTDTITVSLTREDRELIERAAETVGETVEEFMVEAALTRDRVVHDRPEPGLWEDTDRESETPTQTPRKSPEPGPPIFDDAVGEIARLRQGIEDLARSFGNEASARAQAGPLAAPIKVNLDPSSPHRVVVEGETFREGEAEYRDVEARLRALLESDEGEARK